MGEAVVGQLFDGRVPGQAGHALSTVAPQAPKLARQSALGASVRSQGLLVGGGGGRERLDRLALTQQTLRFRAQPPRFPC